MNAFTLLEKNKELLNYAKIFTISDCSPSAVIDNGIRFLLAKYKAPAQEELVDNQICATRQHLYRVYYQV